MMGLDQCFDWKTGSGLLLSQLYYYVFKLNILYLTEDWCLTDTMTANWTCQGSFFLWGFVMETPFPLISQISQEPLHMAASYRGVCQITFPQLFPLLCPVVREIALSMCVEISQVTFWLSRNFSVRLPEEFSPLKKKSYFRRLLNILLISKLTAVNWISYTSLSHEY